MISLSTLALLALISAIPAGLGYLAGHKAGTTQANAKIKANSKSRSKKQ